MSAIGKSQPLGQNHLDSNECAICQNPYADNHSDTVWHWVDFARNGNVESAASHAICCLTCYPRWQRSGCRETCIICRMPFREMTILHPTPGMGQAGAVDSDLENSLSDGEDDENDFIGYMQQNREAQEPLEIERRIERLEERRRVILGHSAEVGVYFGALHAIAMLGSCLLGGSFIAGTIGFSVLNVSVVGFVASYLVYKRNHGEPLRERDRKDHVNVARICTAVALASLGMGLFNLSATIFINGVALSAIYSAGIVIATTSCVGAVSYYY